MEIDHDAPVVVALDLTIAAPLATVWGLHTDIDAWPRWNAGIDTAELAGDLAVGSQFTWETSGLTITSTIGEIVPQRRIAWGGETGGIDGRHSWTFTETADGTVVHTEESWDGDPVQADPEGLHAALEGSLIAWLDALKSAAESPPPTSD